MIIKAVAKTLYSISELLVRRSNQDKMMYYHLRLCRTQLSAITKE